MQQITDEDLKAIQQTLGGLARARRFTRILEVIPGSIYEFRRPNNVDFRVTIAMEVMTGRWTWAVDVTVGARVWQRVGKHAGISQSPAAALAEATQSISLDEAPYGDGVPA